MVPADNHDFVGAVYILQDNEIIGVVEAILFRQCARVMLDRFFRPPASDTASQTSSSSHVAPRVLILSSSAIASEIQSIEPMSVDSRFGVREPYTTRMQAQVTTSNPTASDSVIRAFEIIAEKLAVEIRMLTDDMGITDFGLDSLMPLVLSQGLHEELKIEIRDAFFLEVSILRTEDC